MDLAKLRGQIDAIDDALVRLLAERAAVARRMGAAKRAVGLAAVDPEREAELRRRWAERAAAAGLGEAAALAVLDAILLHSRSLVEAVVRGEERDVTAPSLDAMPSPDVEEAEPPGDPRPRR